MKRHVRGGVQEAVALLIRLGSEPHGRFYFEYNDPGPDGVPTVRYDITDPVIREIEEEEP